MLPGHSSVSQIYMCKFSVVLAAEGKTGLVDYSLLQNWPSKRQEIVDKFTQMSSKHSSPINLC